MPYVASEIVTCELDSVMKEFFYNGEASDTTLFDFYVSGVLAGKEVNSVLAGYFEKIF